MLFWVLPPRAFPGPYSKYQRRKTKQNKKTPLVSSKRRKKVTIFIYCRAFCSRQGLNLRENSFSKSNSFGFYQSLTYLWEREYQNQLPLAILYHSRGKHLWYTGEYPSPEAKAHQKTETNSGTIEHFPFPHTLPLHY